MIFDILLLEHRQPDVEAFQEALALSPALPGRLHVVGEGAQALDFLARRGTFSSAPAPSLVILDARAPGLRESGLLDAIASLRGARGAAFPVLMTAAARSRNEIDEAYRRHVSAYAVLPADRAALRRVLRQVLEYWLTFVQLPQAHGGAMDR